MFDALAAGAGGTDAGISAIAPLEVDAAAGDATADAVGLDWAAASALANSTNIAAASDAPIARRSRALLVKTPAFLMLHHAALSAELFQM